MDGNHQIVQQVGNEKNFSLLNGSVPKFTRHGPADVCFMCSFEFCEKYVYSDFYHILSIQVYYWPDPGSKPLALIG